MTTTTSNAASRALNLRWRPVAVSFAVRRHPRSATESITATAGRLRVLEYASEGTRFCTTPEDHLQLSGGRIHARRHAAREAQKTELEGSSAR